MLQRVIRESRHVYAAGTGKLPRCDRELGEIRCSLRILTVKLIEVSALEQHQIVRVQFPDTVVFRRFG